MALGIEAASLYAAVGVDVGRAVTNLTRVDSAFDRATRSAELLERAADDFGVEAQEWANDFGKVAQEASDASIKIDRLARRRQMPIAEADRLRETLDRLGNEADQAGAEMAELARQGKSVDPTRSAQLAREIDRVEKELQQATTQADRFDREMDAAAQSGGRFQGVLGKMGPLLGALGFAGVTYGIVQMVRSMVSGASEMEKFRVQFEVLLGSADAANARIQELAEFGKTTPFELPEVVRASRTLEVFTKGVLAAGDGLRLVGDVAAGTGMPFEDVAMWVGRMYDALQSGRPFGEATMRLQEMGAIGGESRQRIEELAAGIKSGAITMEDAWAGVSAEFSRFDGMMEKQSRTIAGQWSNLMDTIGMGLTRMGESLMPLITATIPKMIDGFGSMLAAGKPVMEFIANRLVVAMENLDAILLAVASVAMFKFISGLTAIEVRAKAAAIAIRGVATAMLLFTPEIIESGDVVTDWVQRMIRGEEAADKFAIALEQLNGDRLATALWSQELEKAGVSLERWVAAMNAAGGDINLALANMRQGIDPFADAWAQSLSNAGDVADREARRASAAVQTHLVDELTRQMDEIDDQFGRFVTKVEETPEGIAATLRDGTVLVGESAEELAGLVSNAFDQAEADAIQSMKDMMSGIADVMSATELEKLVQDHADAMANEWSDYGRRAFIETQLASDQIRQGLSSSDTDTVQNTINLVEALLGQYDAMAPGALERGELVNPALLEGIRSNMGLTEQEIEDIAEALGVKLDFSDAAEGYGAGNIASYADGVAKETSRVERAAMAVAGKVRWQMIDNVNLWSGGVSAMESWIQGMENRWNTGIWRVWGIGAAIKRALGGSLPTEGPMAGGLGSGGVSIVDSWVDGMVAAMSARRPELEGAIGGLGGAFALSPGVGTSVAPNLGPDIAAGGIAGSGELHIHTHLEVQGDLKARDTQEAEDAMMRATRFSLPLVAAD